MYAAGVVLILYLLSFLQMQAIATEIGFAVKTSFDPQQLLIPEVLSGIYCND